MKLCVALTVMLSACSPSEHLASNEPSQQAAMAMETEVEGERDSALAAREPVAGLPFSHGKSFRSLDDYLAHLQRHAAPIDQPWWREIRPGIYEHVKRMPGAPRETATRAELMRRFGFSN